jgi:DNA-binding MarR family transcriptional regulator
MTNMPFKPEETFGFAIHHASFAFRTALKMGFDADGLALTIEEFVLLGLVPQNGATQRVLVQKSLKDKTTVTRLVDRLVSKGLVTRQENPDNRREQIVRLTKDGGERLLQAALTAQQVSRKALEGIESDKIEAAHQLLKQVTRNLT